MPTELWGERGLVTGIFLDLSAEAQPDRWRSFLSAINFAAGGPDPNYWGQIDSVWCVVEPSFGKDGFGFPDAVACITFKDATRATVFFEAKTRTYAECVLRPAERHRRGYNSKLNGQLELKVRLALALEAHNGAMALRDELWIAQTPYRHAGFPRRVLDMSVLEILVPRMRTENAGRYFFVAMTSDDANPFDDQALQAYWPEIFTSTDPLNNQWESARHRFGWIGWQSVQRLAEAWPGSLFSSAYALNAHYLATQANDASLVQGATPPRRTPRGVSVIYAPGISPDAQRTALHFSWRGPGCRLRNYIDPPHQADQFRNHPDRPIQRQTLEVAQYILSEHRVVNPPGVENATAWQQIIRALNEQWIG